MFFITGSLFHSYVESDIFGKGIFLSLLFLSIVSWVILIHKIVLMKKLQKACDFFEKFLDCKKDRLLHIKEEHIHHKKNPFYDIYHALKNATLEVLNKNSFFEHEKDSEKKEVYLSQSDIELVAAHIDTTIDKRTRFLEKNLFVLSTTVTLAPFLGLLGTVWGILLTFSHLQTHSLASGSSEILSGLSMALGTTVVGLIVAIPALVAYNYLRHIVKNFNRDMENFSHRMVTRIEIQYRKVDVR